MTLGTDIEIFVVSVLAGVLGALAGIGGGLLVVPALTIVFGIDIRFAIGASIVSVIATSSGAAAAYVRDRLTNLRIGMFLELATTSGAVIGALLVSVVPTEFLFLLLGTVLLLSAAMQLGRLHEVIDTRPPDPLAERLGLVDVYPDARLGRDVPYHARRIPLGVALMGLAGLVSGLLGIGSGALKVLAMDVAMGLPIKVSTATSNFMIGVTAAASAGIYVGRGDVDVRIAAPVALGVLVGAVGGARLLGRLSNRTVRLLFVPVLAAIGIETILRGFGFGL